MRLTALATLIRLESDTLARGPRFGVTERPEAVPGVGIVKVHFFRVNATCRPTKPALLAPSAGTSPCLRGLIQ